MVIKMILKQLDEVISDNLRMDEREIMQSLYTQATMNGALVNDLESPEYEQGVFLASFTNKDAVEAFIEACFMSPYIDDDIDVDTYTYDSNGHIIDDPDSMAVMMHFKKYVVTAYVLPEFVEYEAVDVWQDEEGNFLDDEDEFTSDVKESVEDDEDLTEVRRKIKVNAKGKRRIKMQCLKGFKWNAATKSCMKITGSELSKKRKSIRRAIITKRSLGAGFKIRVNRKTRKAKRFRKSMGLKT